MKQSIVKINKNKLKKRIENVKTLSAITYLNVLASNLGTGLLKLL